MQNASIITAFSSLILSGSLKSWFLWAAKYGLQLPPVSRQCPILKPGDKARVGKIEITATPTKHGEEKALGFVFKGSKTLGFTGDGEYFKGQEKHFQGCDYLLVNVLRPRGVKWPEHMNTEQAVELIKKVRPKLAVIQHFGMIMLKANPEKEARWIEKQTGVRTIAARDGMTIDPERESSRPSLRKWAR